jgi:hypothetical protein
MRTVMSPAGLAQPEEIAHVKMMLQPVKKNLTDQNIAFLVTSVEKAG